MLVSLPPLTERRSCSRHAGSGVSCAGSGGRVVGGGPADRLGVGVGRALGLGGTVGEAGRGRRGRVARRLSCGREEETPPTDDEAAGADGDSAPAEATPSRLDPGPPGCGGTQSDGTSGAATVGGSAAGQSVVSRRPSAAAARPASISRCDIRPGARWAGSRATAGSRTGGGSVTGPPSPAVGAGGSARGTGRADSCLARERGSNSQGRPAASARHGVVRDLATES